MLALSPELCGRIVYYSYREDLLALCLACKAFQREAEVRLYYHIQLTDTHQALLVCNTLVHNDRLPLHVRTFCFRQDDRRAPGDLGHRFWGAVQQALIAMSNLEVLVLCDASHSNGWVLSHPEIKFSLKEAKLRLTWDAPLIKFLERQQALQTLHVYDPLEDIAHHIIPGSLPNLKVFDGTLMVGMQLIPSPLVYLQLMIDSDPAPALAALPGFGALRKSLRSLNLLEVTEDLSLPILRCVSGVLPDLRHLGILHYPMTAKPEFHKYLMRMHLLASIDLDVGHWLHPPALVPAQKVLASELQIFCPSVRTISFWFGSTRVRWMHTSSGTWNHRIEPQQYQQLTNVWNTI